MDLLDYIAIAATTLASLGGGGVVVFSLSGWLGKLWADRLMQKEIMQHSWDLESLRSELAAKNSEAIETLKHDLEITKEKYLNDHADKTTIYRGAVDLIAAIVSKIEMILLGKREELTPEELEEFEVKRLRIYAYLAMHSPQSVMTANDELMDLIVSVIYDGEETTWQHFRNLSISLLNEIRKDLGVNPEPISYQGQR